MTASPLVYPPTVLPANFLQMMEYQMECRLQGGTSPVLRCPEYALPEIARHAFLEMRMNINAPDEVVIAALLGAMSFACQRSIRVQPPHTDTPQVTTLAIYTGADTGSGKSPVLNRLFKLAHEVSRAPFVERKRGEKGRNDDRLLLHAKRRGLLARLTKLSARGTKANPEEIAELEQAIRDLPGAPLTGSKPVYTVKGDISPSKLLDDLDGDRVSIVVATAEGRKFFGKLTDEDMETHNLVLDGATVTCERMHRTVIANEPLATYCCYTHLDAFARLIKKKGDEARASGWLGRALISRASSNHGYGQDAVLRPSFPKTDVFIAQSSALLEGFEGSATNSPFEPITLEFDEEATLEFMEMLRKNRQRMEQRDDWGLIQDFGRKHPSNVARIAAIFHYFCNRTGTRISKETLLCAIRVADWYMEQARQILVIEPMRLKLKKLITFLHDKWYTTREYKERAERGEEPLAPIRWIMQYHNIDAAELYPLLDRLVSEKAIKYQTPYGGMRCIWLNPTVFNAL
jgi:hypothetical protein